MTKNDIYILIPWNQAPKAYLVYSKTSLLKYFSGLKNMHGKQCKTISTKLKLVMEKWNGMFSVHVILLLIWSRKVISQTGKD